MTTGRLACQILRIRRLSAYDFDERDLPDALKAFVDEQTSERGFGTSGEYILELIRRDRDRQRFRAVLLAGVESKEGVIADEAFFAALRDRAAAG